IKPGKHIIFVADRTEWHTRNSVVRRLKPDQADEETDATLENLWFLKARRSQVDASESLCFDDYRCAQPLVLEPFFKALQEKDISAHLPGLFQSADEIVPRRTLEFIAGGDAPWPWTMNFWFRQPVNGPILRQHADQVRALVTESKNKKIRQLAIAVYGHLTEDSSADFMLAQLNDEDPIVRAIALGIMAKYKTPGPTDAIVNAARGLAGGDRRATYVVCQMIQRFEERSDLSGVPVLIEFLQDDRFSGNDWNDVPAIKSRAALLKITKHWFPLDVAKSRDAWAKAKDIKTSQELKTYLDRTVPEEPEPLQAKAVSENHFILVEIKNVTKQPLTLTKSPCFMRFTYSFSRGGGGNMGRNTKGHPDPGKEDFVLLKPGASHKFKLPGNFGNLIKGLVPEDKRTLTLAYLSNGNKVGVNAWLGVVDVKIGTVVNVTVEKVREDPAPE
ncbi:MAG: hypothetical protein JWN70_3738, partial [Planctomycetaceae bacterium]|nr:hypothetical protein [Planctomycetaceae bacterium]